MRVHEIEAVVGQRERLAVGDEKIAVKPLLREIRVGQVNRRSRQVDAGHACAPPRANRARSVARATADLEDRSSAVFVEGYQSQQMMKLLEMILVEIVEEVARSHGMLCDLEIVDVSLPIFPDVVGCRHDG